MCMILCHAGKQVKSANHLCCVKQFNSSILGSFESHWKETVLTVWRRLDWYVGAHGIYQSLFSACTSCWKINRDGNSLLCSFCLKKRNQNYLRIETKVNTRTKRISLLLNNSLEYWCLLCYFKFRSYRHCVIR